MISVGWNFLLLVADRELQEGTFGAKAEPRGTTAEGHVRTRHLSGFGEMKSQARNLEDHGRGEPTLGEIHDDSPEYG